MTRLDITPDDVLRVAGGGYVPWHAHLEEPPPAAALDAEGWAAFRRAKARGYPVEPPALPRAAATVWGWWCLAVQRAEVVVRDDARNGAWAVRLDLSPAGLCFTPMALVPIGQAMGATGREEDGWFVSPETCEVDGLDLETAMGLAEALLGVVGHQRCVHRRRAVGRQAG